MDLSDCLPSELAIQFGVGPPDPTTLDDVIIALTGDLNARIFDDDKGRIRRRREHVFALVTFARTTYWDGEDRSQVYLLRKVSSIAYYRGIRTISEVCAPTRQPTLSTKGL